eukprot:Nitzschia sp. Nitz4//scaffold38_size140716//59805//61322//NITZ4_003141-RA/size140716-snap-gene-0.141-mRNA-1//1//CDS//3329550060//1741//frame0
MNTLEENDENQSLHEEREVPHSFPVAFVQRPDDSNLPEQSDLMTPLITDTSRQPNVHRENLRHRPSRVVDHEDSALASLDGSRILDRSRAFRQSRGRWRVQRVSRTWSESNLGGWFYSLAYQRTGILMLILASVYIFIVVAFAAIYLTAAVLGQTSRTDPDGSEIITPFCHMDISSRMEALYLSLSTMAAIGYGISNYFIGDCWTPLILVICQVLCAITFDAVAVGLLFHRISRGRKRSRTIAFSDKAVIQRVNGMPYLMFRMGELRRYHLISASIRCYCVRHCRIPKQPQGENISMRAVPIDTTHFVSRQMKLLHPDETMGSDVWMGLPQVIVHRMDQESPLIPDKIWYDASGTPQQYPSSLFPSGVGDMESQDNSTYSQQGDLGDVAEFLSDRDVEIVVLVEGTDESTGAATQARHSYKPCDLAWNHAFLPCVFPVYDSRIGSHTNSGSDPVCRVDFSHFHDITPAPEDCEASPYVSRS